MAVGQTSPPRAAPPAQSHAARPPAQPAPRPSGAVDGSRRVDVGLMIFLVCVALAVHAVNMFNFPAVLEDEGTYAAQAWAVLRLHRLTPYTFTYDHAPGGWFLAALWMLLTGGPSTFGGTIPSVRVLMLLLHLASVALLYRLARKLGCRPAGATLATLVFTLSPLALAYQRAFVLDNVMVFWLLVSLNLLLDGWGRLSRLVLSGIAFGLAVLSKETALFLIPAIAYIAYRQRWRHQGSFAVGAWAVPAFLTLSLYGLYALLKGELLPAGHALGFQVFSRGSPPKSSLVEAVRWQLTRQGGGHFFSLHNAFWQLVAHVWSKQDPLLLAVGAAAVAFNLIRGLRDRRALATGLLGALSLLYLARGGVVFDFYVLFALPFLALNIGVAATALLRRRHGVLAWGLTALAVAVLVGFSLETGRLQPFFNAPPARADRQAVAWVKANVPPGSRIVVADDFWADLHERGLGGPAFPNAHSHWKVVDDPAIRNGVFHDDWRRVDYLLTTAQAESDLRATGNKVALDALARARVVRTWTAGTNAVHLWHVEGATGGVKQDAMTEAAGAYLANAFERDGAFVAGDGSVTSEAQSYGLLRALWSNDPAGFARIWGWTQTHLLRPDGLSSWLWKDGNVADASSATDADTDTAYALLTAAHRWGSPAYLARGQAMVAAIWAKEVVAVGTTPYATAGDWGAGRDVLPLNPSYFAPYAYRVFGRLDPAHDWYGLLNAGYQMIDAASNAALGAQRSAGLPPDWIGLNRSTAALEPLALPGKDTTRYSFDAARLFWRVALDGRWTGDGRDTAFLQRAAFLADEVARKGTVSAAYGHDGSVIEAGASPVATAGALAALMHIDPVKADQLYAHAIAAPSAQQQSPQGTYWGNPTDLYGQEWTWFAAAFSSNHIPDLWAAQQ